MNILLSDLLLLVDGHLLSGVPEMVITGFSSLKEAGPGDLSFFSDSRYESTLSLTRASAVLVSAGSILPPAGVACILVANPSRAFDTVVDRFGFQPPVSVPGVHPTAVVAESAVFNPGKVCIGPQAVISGEVVLGDGTEIGAGCYIGPGVAIGAHCRLAANSTVQGGCLLGDRVIIHSGTVIGADGFGYEFEDGQHRKVRQSGIVQIDNDVEIGAGTMIDRARFGRTWIGAGTKIDNLVQIGHNAVIGRHCIIVSAVAIAGSAVIGDYVVIAAQSGVAGHVSIGSKTTLGARSGVTKDLPAGGIYMGFPAAPMQKERRRLAAVRRLPELMARVQELEERLKALEAERVQNPAPVPGL
ncbi:MAG: UDP-3-O-(3-hydroxymyristoyl)glucosamine N-acyltransferase [Verrucomicrobiota bacterium]